MRPEVERGVGQVALDPAQVRTLGPGRFEHGRVDVEPDHGATAAVQLERHPPGAAAGIEHGRGIVGIDQRGLTVHVDARGRRAGSKRSS